MNPTDPPHGSGQPAAEPPRAPATASSAGSAMKRPWTTPGNMVAWVAALACSAFWIRMRPDSPVGGAGGAIFPVLVVITIIYFSVTMLGPALDENVFMKQHARRLRLERQGAPFLREMEKALKTAQRKLAGEKLDAFRQAMTRLRDALEKDETSDDQLAEALSHAEQLMQELLGRGRKSVFMDFTESIGGALVIAILLRLFVVEAFKIPSGSMIPTLAIGDHIFVNKFVYGLTLPLADPPKKVARFRDPTPGEVVVFIAPPPADNAGEDFIKRVVAVQGQRIKLVAGVLHVDGKPYERTGGEQHAYDDASDRSPFSQRLAQHFIEDTAGIKHSVMYEPGGRHDWPGGVATNLNGLDCTPDECTVKPGWIFCMGDNRDNSADSRRWGAVPIENVKGRAMFVWMSLDYSKGGALPRIRWDRLGTSIH